MSLISFGRSPQCCHCHMRDSEPNFGQCGHHHKAYPKTKYPRHIQSQSLILRAMQLPFTKFLDLLYSIIWLCKQICEFYFYLILFATTLGAQLFRLSLRLGLSLVDDCLMRIFDFFSWGVNRLRALSNETPTRQVMCSCSIRAGRSGSQQPFVVKMPQISRRKFVGHGSGGRASDDCTEDQARELKNCIQLRGVEKEEVGGVEPLPFDPPLERATGSAEDSDPMEARIAAEVEAITKINECDVCAESSDLHLPGKRYEVLNNDEYLSAENPLVRQSTTQQPSMHHKEPPSSSISPGSTTRAPTAQYDLSQPTNIEISSAVGSTSRNKLHKHRVQPCTRCSACARRQSVGTTRLPRKVSSPECPRHASFDSCVSGNDPYSKASRWVRKHGMRRPGSDTVN